MSIIQYKLGTGLPIDPKEWLTNAGVYLEDAEEERADRFEEQRLDLLPYFMDKNGRLTPTWASTAWTSRITAMSPPVQQIPKAMRSAIREPGKLVIVADWRASQLRLLAHASRDSALTNDLETGDPYTCILSDLGIDETDMNRQLVKRSVLATLFGQGEAASSRLFRESGLRINKTVYRAMYDRWPRAMKIAGRLMSVKSYTTKDGTTIVVPEDKHGYGGLAGVLQAVEADALRRVIEGQGEGLPELCAVVHDETVWLTTPLEVDNHMEAVANLMKKALRLPSNLSRGAVSVTCGRSWGEQDNNPVPPAASRPVSVKAWCRKAADLDKSPKTPDEMFMLNMLSIHQPEKYSSLISRTEMTASGRKKGSVLRALRKEAANISTYLKYRGDEAVRKTSGLDIPVLRTGSHVEIGSLMAKEIQPFTFSSTYGYRKYEEGVYVEVPENKLQLIAQNYDGKVFEVDGKLKRVSFNSAKNILESARAHLTDDNFFHLSDAIAFQNGVLVEKRGEYELTDFNHEVHILCEHQLPFEYNPKARAPRWRKFMRELWAGDENAEEKVNFFQEFVGNCLLGRAAKHQKHCILLGEKASNGKSATLKIISELFPEAMRTASPPHEWSQRFGMGSLVNARLNVVNEMPENDLMAKGNVKAVLDGSDVNIERKFKDKVRASIKCGHLIAANSLPSSSDKSEGMFRRWEILSCNNRWVPKTHFNNQPRTFIADPDISDAIIKQEMEGIVNWALEGAARFMEQGKSYTVVASSEEDKVEWRAASSSVYDFKISWMDRQTPAKYKSSQVYGEYVKWCEKNRRHPVSHRKFNSEIKNYSDEYMQVYKSGGYTTIKFGKATNNVIDFAEASHG